MPECGCDAGASYPTYRGRMCRPDKAFTPHPAMVSNPTRLSVLNSPANQRAAAMTPCPETNRHHPPVNSVERAM
ncbi:hypothetical protein ACVXHA_03550 [Escherichia coli]